MSPQGSPHLVVLTGAGCSAESGLRTFRDNNGLWEGHRVEEVATPEAWAADPRTVWRFYQLRRAQLQSAKPNAAHEALAKFEREGPMRMTLITQNVDDLHQRAGSNPLAMHGELVKLRCEACGVVSEDRENYEAERFVPCPHCGHEKLRPHIVWFGEIPLEMERIEAAMKSCTHFAAIGTSGVVYPAAGLLSQARHHGAKTWVNSLDAPDNLHPQDTFMPGPATKIAPLLLASVMQSLSATPAP